eukprot:gene1630-3161_t
MSQSQHSSPAPRASQPDEALASTQRSSAAARTSQSASYKANTPLEESYDPGNSTTTREGFEAWMASPITGDILEVPGIDGRNKELLSFPGEKEDGVGSTFELFGKFLLFKTPGISTAEHCNRFWFWLKSKGVVSHRSAIVQACAERLETMMPGIYDREVYNRKNVEVTH